MDIKGGYKLMSNSLAIPSANKAIRQIEQLEKTLNEISKVIFDDQETTLLTHASDSLNVTKLRIEKIRGWF